jgi:hypothetical protein
MARVVLTESARVLAMGQLLPLEGVGVLLLAWAGPVKDLVRTSEGDAEWKTYSHPAWEASVGAWPEATRESVEAEALNIDGVPVILDPRARRCTGAFTVDAIEGKFKVTLLNDE